MPDDLAPRFFGDRAGMDTKSSVPYIKEFLFLFRAGTPRLFNARPLADDLVGEPSIVYNIKYSEKLSIIYHTVPFIQLS